MVIIFEHYAQGSKTHEELRVVKDQTGCPTYAQDIADAVKRILGNIEVGKASVGLYHLQENHFARGRSLLRNL